VHDRSLNLGRLLTRHYQQTVRSSRQRPRRGQRRPPVLGALILRIRLGKAVPRPGVGATSMKSCCVLAHVELPRRGKCQCMRPNAHAGCSGKAFGVFLMDRREPTPLMAIHRRGPPHHRGRFPGPSPCPNSEEIPWAHSFTRSIRFCLFSRKTRSAGPATAMEAMTRPL